MKILEWTPTMLPRKVRASRWVIPHKLSLPNRLRRRPILDPPHQRHQHIRTRIQRRGGAQGDLPNRPRTLAAAAVAHAEDAEVAVERVEGGGRGGHGVDDVRVVAHTVFGCDDLVLHAVAGRRLATARAERGEVAVPGLDVARADT